MPKKVASAAVKKIDENRLKIDEVEAQHELVSALVTRQVQVKSEEGRSKPALAAREKELSGHRRRGTWDESSVREFKALMNDSSKAEVMLGRVFGKDTSQPPGSLYVCSIRQS